MGERLGPAAVADVLDAACARHGGRETYRRTRTLSLRLAELAGPLPWVKGIGRRYAVPRAVDIRPHDRRVVFLDYPQAGQVGIYDDGRVAIGLDPDRRLDGPSHRVTFVGIAKWRTWWPEDAVYFLGYALLLYLSLPFCLGEQEVVSARRGEGGVELWCRFPAGADTHSELQGFWFDASGLLVRHDYRVDILGAAFNGAHLSAAYREIGGLQVATRRTVYAKPWHLPLRARLPIVVLSARLAEREPVPLVATGPGTTASRSSAGS